MKIWVVEKRDFDKDDDTRKNFLSREKAIVFFNKSLKKIGKEEDTLSLHRKGKFYIEYKEEDVSYEFFTENVVE